VARRPEEKHTPVRPKIAEAKQLATAEKAVEEVKAVEKSEVKAARQPSEKNEEVVKRCHDCGFELFECNCPEEEQHLRDKEEALSQDGLRDDPQHEMGEAGSKTSKNTKVHTPTRDEVEDHERTHCPFKAWCKHCVRGRGRNLQHKRAKREREDQEDGKVARVSMD